MEQTIFLLAEDYIAYSATGNQKNFCLSKIRPVFVTGATINTATQRVLRPCRRSSAIAVPNGLR